jgi:MYXO-CTERM domain-containing protein
MIHGVRHTGKFVDLPTGRFIREGEFGHAETRHFEVTDTIPSFGYVIDHEMTGSERGAFEKATKGQKLSAWTTDLAGLEPLRSSDQRIVPGRYTVEVAANDVAHVAPTVEFSGLGQGPPGPTGCGCPAGSGSNTTPSKVGALGMFVAVGAVVFRRRRRR